MRRTSWLRAGLVLLALASPTRAYAQAAPTVDRQAWAKTGAAGPPQPHNGDVYIAAAGGQEQARAFVHVDVAGLDAAAIDKTSLVLVPASDAVLAGQAAVIACALAVPLTASGELSGPPPAADCALRTSAVRGDGSWRVPLSVFADAWSSGHDSSLALLPDPDAAASVFSLSLDTTKTVLAGVVAPVPAAPPSPPTTPPPVDAAAPTPPAVPAPAVVAVDLPPPPEVIAPVEQALAPPAHRPVRAAPAAHRTVIRGRRSTADPSPAVILLPLVLAAAALWALSRRRPPRVATAVLDRRTALRGLAWVAVPVAVMTLGETTIYKVGLVAVAFIAAIGLHLLVNWTGELSLAHAGFIGVPAFAVAQLSSHSGLSPLIGLPLAVAVGVVLGGLVGMAALRSRGLQVALVTLAVGIAVGQFLFFRTWVVGPPGGLQMPVPSVFGLELRTSRALTPVLAAAVLLAVLAATSIMRSKVGRALLLVRSDPDAAAAAGVAVAAHRALAYAFAGGFAGLAGWAYVVWVQQVSAKAFPLQLGFTYLVIAALAGPGGLGGVVVAAALIIGGALFSVLPHSVALYLAPIALIVNVTRYKDGFNGVLRTARSAVTSRWGITMGELRTQAVAGTLAVVAGFTAIGLAWYHMGNTDAVWVQNQELLSGGIAGLGLILLGSVLLLRDALLSSRRPPQEPVGAATPTTNGRRPLAAAVKEPG